MLRYDACFPKSESDAMELQHSIDGTTAWKPRRVTVIRYTDTKEPKWTFGRWESMGWLPVSDPPKTDVQIVETFLEGMK